MFLAEERFFRMAETTECQEHLQRLLTELVRCEGLTYFQMFVRARALLELLNDILSKLRGPRKRVGGQPKLKKGQAEGKNGNSRYFVIVLGSLFLVRKEEKKEAKKKRKLFECEGIFYF